LENNVHSAIAIFGGTFNPVHHGHIRSALELGDELGLSEVRLMPCHRPVHREQPECSSEHRLAMLNLAIEGKSMLSVDDRELRRSDLSYSIDSLIELRNELGDQVVLCMVVGSDAFAKLETWHRWQELLDYAHIIVLSRPGYSLPNSSSLQTWLKQVCLENKTELLNRPAGGVLMLELTQLLISATVIRAQIIQGVSPRFLMPDAVWQYINEQQLYGCCEN